ncbi:hypothetical protein FOCC_FOCC004543 [Frankliniella occidentalis]|nr:hypothetical protein FOCC_FOCC004543 [Frankliniella occidentalis]
MSQPSTTSEAANATDRHEEGDGSDGEASRFQRRRATGLDFKRPAGRFLERPGTSRTATSQWSTTRTVDAGIIVCIVGHDLLLGPLSNHDVKEVRPATCLCDYSKASDNKYALSLEINRPHDALARWTAISVETKSLKLATNRLCDLGLPAFDT